MKFVLWLDPDVDDTDHQALLMFAVASVKSNPGLAWDITNDDGTVVAEHVILTEGLPEDTCIHCQRRIFHHPKDGWIDPEAGTDVENGDGIWRTVCDEHDSPTADHEPGGGAFADLDLSHMDDAAEWRSAGTDEPRDQRRDLHHGSCWAEVGPDAQRKSDGWAWSILDYDTGDQIASGFTDTEDEAKAAVAAWKHAG